MVLLHSSAEATSHTLLYKPCFSLIMGPVAQKLRQYTCPYVLDRGKHVSSQDVVKAKSVLGASDNPEIQLTRAHTQALRLSLTLELKGKGGEAVFSPARNPLQDHEAYRQHQ